MTANDLLELFVGEIGFPRREFLYEISFWEARRIMRGYRNRYRDMWSAIRWHAYRIMGAIPYTDLEKAGIRRPTDLIKFPWETEEKQPEEEWTDEDIQREREWLIAQNKEYSEKSGNP